MVPSRCFELELNKDNYFLNQDSNKELKMMEKEVDMISLLLEENIKYQMEMEKQNRLLNIELRDRMKKLELITDYLKFETKANKVLTTKKSIEEDLQIFGIALFDFKSKTFLKEYETFLENNLDEPTNDKKEEDELVNVPKSNSSQDLKMTEETENPKIFKRLSKVLLSSNGRTRKVSISEVDVKSSRKNTTKSEKKN